MSAEKDSNDEGVTNTPPVDNDEEESSLRSRSRGKNAERKRRTKKRSAMKKRRGIAEKTPDILEEKNGENATDTPADPKVNVSSNISSSKNDETSEESNSEDDISDDDDDSETELLVEEKGKAVNLFKERHLYNLAVPAVFCDTQSDHKILVKRETTEDSTIGGAFKADQDRTNDGLYVPRKPLVSKWNMNVHARRNKRNDVDVVTLPFDPINDRGRITFEVDDTKDATDKLLTFNCAPALSQSGTAHLSVASSQRVQLVLNVSRIQFFDHEHFSAEDQVAMRMRTLYRPYADAIRENHIGSRWHELRTKHAAVCGNDESAEGDMPALSGLVDAFSMWVAEVMKLRRASGELYAYWKRLKRVRKRQKFRSTRLRLVAKRVRLFERDRVDAIIRSIRNRIDRLSIAETDTKMEKREKSSASSVMGRWFNVLNNAKLILQHEKDYAMRIGEDLSYTSDASDDLPNAERQRRKSVREEKIHVRVLVNGGHVHTIPAVALRWPEYSVRIDQSLRFAVFRRPWTVQLDICRRGIFGRSVVVGTVALTPPGSESRRDDVTRVHTSPSLAPVVGSFGFASNEPMQRAFAGTHRSAETLPLKKRKWKVQRHVSGVLDACMYWTVPDLGGSSNAALRVDEDTDLLVLPTTRATPVDDGSWLHRMSKRNLVGQPSTSETSSVSGSNFGDVKSADGEEFEISRMVATSRAKRTGAPIDPNDPRFQSVRLAMRKESSLGSHGHFNIRTISPLPSGAGSADTLRHALLRLRGPMEPFEFRESVPLRGREIEQNETLMTIIREDRDRRGDAIRAEDEDDHLDMSSPENRGQRVANFLRRVQQVIRKTRRARGKHGSRHLEELVREDQLPEFRVDFDLNIDFLEPIRSLDPKVELAAPNRHWNPKCEIMCQVVRAVNVPVRSARRQKKPERDRTASEGVDAPHADGDWWDDRVRPFVEVKFQSTTKETTCQEGPSPIWNEVRELSVHISGEKEITPRSLLALEDNIVFSLMDEVPYEGRRDPYNKLTRERFGSALETESYGRRFLGSFSVPFSVLYKNGGRISGWFEVDVPPVLLGYVSKRNDSAQPKRKAADNDDDDDDDVGTKRAKRSSSFKTMLEILITLQPPMAVPPGVFCTPEVDRSAPHKVKIARRRAVRWFNRLSASKRMQGRLFNPLVPNMRATKTLITRYILPQRPPPMPQISGSGGHGKNRNDTMTSVKEVAAFVSLLPFVNDWQMDSKKEDMWCTSSEFLRLLAGDWEEHAILLCNFMLWLERERGGHASIYVAIGNAIPQGASCFVVRIEKAGGPIDIWDPTTGRMFDSKDRDAPLKSISSLVGRSDASDEHSTNFWANVQETTLPWSISYNVSDSGLWDPLHRGRGVGRKKRGGGLKSVQIDPLPYRPTEASFVVDTDALIEREIRKALRHWRSRELHLTTDFNHTACRALKPLLQSLEEARVGLSNLDTSAHESAVRRLSTSFDIFGFPLHTTFTDIREVIRRVRETNAHRSIVKGTQFAVATFVQGYTNTVCSVWVYIAVLVPR